MKVNANVPEKAVVTIRQQKVVEAPRGHRKTLGRFPLSAAYLIIIFAACPHTTIHRVGGDFSPANTRRSKKDAHPPIHQLRIVFLPH